MRDSCDCFPLIDSNGYTSWSWTSNVGVCVWTDTEKASVIIGLMTIIFWLCAHGKQVYDTFKRKEVDTIPFWFFLQLLAGDIANVVGCVVLYGPSFQLFTALYFCVSGTGMACQYAYYKYCVKRKMEDPSSYRTLLFCLCGAFLVMAIPSPFVSNGNTNDPVFSDSEGVRILHSINDLDWSREDDIGHDCHTAKGYTAPQMAIGITAAWLSASSYFFSRIPKLWLNHKQKAVEGVSPSVFTCTVAANVCYGLGILLNTAHIDPIRDVPFLVGTIGTLPFDVIMLFQMVIYRRGFTDAYDSIPKHGVDSPDFLFWSYAYSGPLERGQASSVSSFSLQDPRRAHIQSPATESTAIADIAKPGSIVSYIITSPYLSSRA